MNNRVLPGSVWLVAIGAGVVLFIGAFARFDTDPISKPVALDTANPPELAQDESPQADDSTPAHPLPTDLSPGIGDIIKLAQAHVDEDVIMAFIRNNRRVYTPSADEILYLSDLGLSQHVIGAIVDTAAPVPTPQTAPITAPATSLADQYPPESAQPPMPALESPVAQPEPPSAVAESQATANAGVFFESLSPYGNWQQAPNYGEVWKPTVETIDPGWTPYVNGGQWLFSDSGWYWQSDYTWGWAPYHYGRWVNVPKTGWVWTPGNIWSPGWVTWRQNQNFIGWAPLPPGVSLNVLGQLTYNSKPVTTGFTFNLPPTAFTFVNVTNLTKRNLPTRVLPAPMIGKMLKRSVGVDNYSFVKNRIFNAGPDVKEVAAMSKEPVHQVKLTATSSLDTAGLAKDKKTLAVYVPPVKGSITAEESSSSERLRNEIALSQPSSPAPNVGGTSEGLGALPPLRYGHSGQHVSAQPNNRYASESAAPIERERAWQNRGGYAENEQRPPSLPQTRYEGEAHSASPSPHPSEPAAHAGAAENHAATPEPPRVAPAGSSAPASSSSSTGSKTGK